MEQDPIVITGRGLITPLGNGVEANVEALRSGRSGIRAVPEWAELNLDSHVAGLADESPECPWLDRKTERFTTANSKMAIASCYEAFQEAGFTRENLPTARTAVINGCAGSSYLEIFESAKLFRETGKVRKVTPMIVPRVMASSAAANLSLILGVKGESYDISSACASGAHAIITGARLLQSGDYDVVICGGSEELNWVHALGFNAIRALAKAYNDDPATASRPFDRSRDGFVIAEGAGIVVLERLSHALRRGATPKAILSGWAANSNATDMVVPDASSGAAVMSAAVRNAGLQATDIAYINTHGTATPVGDPIEMEAIRRVFSQDGKSPAINSTKSMTGHMIGATGAVELIYTTLMLERNFVAGTINLNDPEPEFAWADLPRETRESAGMRHGLTNSFGFGGTNAAIVVSHPDVLK